MTLRVFTARISYGGQDRLDITRAGDTRPASDHLGILFAPSASLLYTYKALKKTEKGLGEDKSRWLDYAKAYREEMRDSYRKNKVWWEELLGQAEKTLVCFCVDVDRCHRTVLAKEILPMLGAIYEGERQGSLF